MSEDEVGDSCRLGRNLLFLVSSLKIGFVSQDSTMEFLSTQVSMGILARFKLDVSDIQTLICEGLEEDRHGDEGGGWDLVEGSEEVLRGDGWLKLNSVGYSDTGVA